jgi:hypothetical protein
MKLHITLLVLFISTFFYAQTTGISYQAVIYNPNPEILPGFNQSNSLLINKNVCLRFSILDSKSVLEYQETIETATDEFGMVNLTIGTGNPIGGYALFFDDIIWDSTMKRLKIELDANGKCSTFFEISNQPFTAVPFAYAAKIAENVTGVVAIANGGTGATTVSDAKINFGLNNVDNTSDLNKPLSIATKDALDKKLDKVLTKPETIETTSTNTLAIKGLENSVVTTPYELVSINPTTGVLSKINPSSVVAIKEVVYIANADENQFITPKSIVDINKISVYRNGVRIGLTKVDSTRIQLETGLFCNDKDEIRIVQFD